MKRLVIAPQQSNAAGIPLGYGRLHLSKPSFADPELTLMHPDPIVLNKDGLVPPIYLKPDTGPFSVSVTDDAGTPIWSADDVIT